MKLVFNFDGEEVDAFIDADMPVIVDYVGSDGTLRTFVIDKDIRRSLLSTALSTSFHDDSGAAVGGRNVSCYDVTDLIDIVKFYGQQALIDIDEEVYAGSVRWLAKLDEEDGE